MESPSTAQDDYQEIAEKVRSGQYFREARGMYDFTVHDPMAERYLYILITCLSALAFVVALFAAQSLYPLQTPIPFIVDIEDPVEDVPVVKRLLSGKGEDASEAVLNFLVQNYVRLRETYDIDTFDRNINGVKNQSTPEVFRELQEFIDLQNPESPIALYQRHSRRKVEILSVAPVSDSVIAVKFASTVEGKGETKKLHWQANIAFNYGGVELDEKGEKIKPLSFVVTQYHTKRIQDIR